jgi:hypothetical protein
MNFLIYYFEGMITLQNNTCCQTIERGVWRKIKSLNVVDKEQ